VLHPPVSSPLAARPGGPSPDAGVTEEFPPIPGDPPGPLRPAAPSGRQSPADLNDAPTQLVPAVPPSGVRPPGQASELESTQAHAGPYVDDSDPGFPPVGAGAGQDVLPSRPDRDRPGDDSADYDRDEYDRGGYDRDDYHGDEYHGDDYDRDDYEDADHPSGRKVDFDDADESDEASPGREWVLMAAQVGVGAIAGAAVWLAFSWLWGMQPVIAVIAALLVIVGLVLGVRRWRRADDLQTTVLAILAGLVVTVSPAALLLLHR
jgi:hypothetical protein